MAGLLLVHWRERSGTEVAAVVSAFGVLGEVDTDRFAFIVDT